MDLKLGKLAQIAFPVADAQRSVDFFKDKLGLELVLRPHETMAFFDCGGVMLYVEQSQGPGAAQGASILYFSCTDIAMATRELEQRGVEIVSQPHCIAKLPAYDLWMSFFKDPEGHLLALHMQAPSGWTPG